MSGALIDITRTDGRPLWCWQYLTSYTYHGFMVRTPSERCNEAMLETVECEAKRMFDAWPVFIVHPTLQPKMLDYPPVRVTAFATSLPVRADFQLSSLVIVWFQHTVAPIPDESAHTALMQLEWERLARDYDA